MGKGCLLPTLANDAARAAGPTHRLFGARLAQAARELAQGCGESDAEHNEDRALAILALCAGGLMLARAMPDEAASNRMLEACREAAAELATGQPLRSARVGRPAVERRIGRLEIFLAQPRNELFDRHDRLDAADALAGAPDVLPRLRLGALA